MKKLLFALIVTSLIVSCAKKQDPFLITKHSIGLLSDSTQVKELAEIYKNDSIKNFKSGDQFTSNISDIEVYEKTGKLLLVLTPSKVKDSTATIKTVKVVDNRFKTVNGLNSASTFKEVKDNYTISGIQNSIRNIIVSVNEENCYFTIEKTELPAEMRYDLNLKIEAVQIPDNAKIKNFYLQWY